jgi:hypothetical protein
MAARAVALGKASAIPAALVLVNIGAIALGTLFVAVLLSESGVTPLLALAWAGYAGQVSAFWRDLAEPLAMALVALALLLLRRRRLGMASVVLLLAALTKETALLFAGAVALSAALNSRWRALGNVIGVVALPYALWQAALRLSLGHTGMSGADRQAALPLAGLMAARGATAWIGDCVVVVGPAVLCLAFVLALLWSAGQFSAQALRDELSSVPTLAVLANLVFVLWLPGRSYADLWASARNADGLVLALLSHPGLASSRLRWVLGGAWVSSAPLLWLR